MAAWNLPGRSVGPPARWAVTSNVEVGQSTLAYPADRRRAAREGREENEDKVSNWMTGTRYLLSKRERERERERAIFGYLQGSPSF